MNKLRLRFSKTGSAVYISHLDLMRMFQRVFLRAGIDVWHTEGFNRHAYVAIALPLPIFHESTCEILDFGMPDSWNGEGLDTMAEKLTAAMPDGIAVQQVYVPQRPVKQLKYVRNKIVYTFDNGVPLDMLSRMEELFARPELIVQKKAKKGGMKDVDIKPQIHSIELSQPDENTIVCIAVLEAMEVYLNPIYLTSALTCLENFTPDQTDYARIEVLDKDLNAFS